MPQLDYTTGRTEGPHHPGHMTDADGKIGKRSLPVAYTYILSHLPCLLGAPADDKLVRQEVPWGCMARRGTGSVLSKVGGGQACRRGDPAYG